MKAAIQIFIFSLVLNCAFADEITDIYVQKAKTFVADNPLITQKVDAIGLIDMWQRIEGLSNLVALLHDYRDEFELPDPKELRAFMVHTRISSHQTKLPLGPNDDLIAALSELIRLHGYTAQAYLDRRVDSGTYSAVASFAIDQGRYLAKQMEAKYGDGKKLIADSPPIDW